MVEFAALALEPEEDAADDEDDRWLEALLEKRLLAPRNPVELVEAAVPAPVLCTVGAEVSDAPELPAADEGLLAAELLPELPAVLTTFT